jgi:hypothetical protein
MRAPIANDCGPGAPPGGGRLRFQDHAHIDLDRGDREDWRIRIHPLDARQSGRGDVDRGDSPKRETRSPRKSVHRWAQR